MNCQKVEELLSAYLEGELSFEDKKAVDKHLRVCSRCASLYQEIKEATESLEDFPEAEMSEALIQKLYEIPQPKKKFQLNLDFLLRPSLQPILAAASVFLILVSFYFFNPNKNVIERQIDRQLHLGYSKIQTLYVNAESLTSSLTESIAAQKEKVVASFQEMEPFKELGIKK